MEMEINQKLQNQFNLEESGYYDITTFIDTHVGFSFKKSFKNEKDYVSLFHLLISNRDYENDELVRKPLLISIIYGKIVDGGISVRSFSSKELNKPVDLDFNRDYFYDLTKDQLYNKKGKKISGTKLLKNIYGKHIKTTYLIRGLIARTKLCLWIIVLPRIFDFISEIFHWLLYIISGDSYTYTFLFKEENLNGTVISSGMDGRIGTHKSRPKGKVEEKPAKEMHFFGNKVAQWPIVFYSIVHLIVWFTLIYIYFPRLSIEKFFANSFLTVLYVIVSFWLVDTVLPFLLKNLIKLFSTMSAISHYKKIHI
ncbi:MAG: hypothetical protein JWL88_336 [Parcubacteria group bacterium]|nr:hypothetical protein [Parcubacteria group bacterium]